MPWLVSLDLHGAGTCWQAEGEARQTLCRDKHGEQTAKALRTFVFHTRDRAQPRWLLCSEQEGS